MRKEINELKEENKRIKKELYIINNEFNKYKRKYNKGNTFIICPVILLKRLQHVYSLIYNIQKRKIRNAGRNE